MASEHEFDAACFGPVAPSFAVKCFGNSSRAPLVVGGCAAYSVSGTRGREGGREGGRAVAGVCSSREGGKMGEGDTEDGGNPGGSTHKKDSTRDNRAS